MSGQKVVAVVRILFAGLCLGTFLGRLPAQGQEPSDKEKEAARVQQFWRDHYDGLRRYYQSIDGIDWVAYCKNHGYQINPTGCGPTGCGMPINYAPVFVPPTIPWALPSS